MSFQTGHADVPAVGAAQTSEGLWTGVVYFWREAHSAEGALEMATVVGPQAVVWSCPPEHSHRSYSTARRCAIEHRPEPPA